MSTSMPSATSSHPDAGQLSAKRQWQNRPKFSSLHTLERPFVNGGTSVNAVFFEIRKNIIAAQSLSPPMESDRLFICRELSSPNSNPRHAKFTIICPDTFDRYVTPLADSPLAAPTSKRADNPFQTLQGIGDEEAYGQALSEKEKALKQAGAQSVPFLEVSHFDWLTHSNDEQKLTYLKKEGELRGVAITR